MHPPGAPQFTAGTQNYDFVYIDDVARAFRLIGEKGKPFHEYLIGSSTARPLKEFLLEMKAPSPRIWTSCSGTSRLRALICP